MVRDAFLIVFRSLARRYSACLAEVNRLGERNLNQIGVEVVDEIAALHKRFEELDCDDLDMRKIRAEIDAKETEKNQFYGQWNRVTYYVLGYEDIYGEDPEVLKAAEEWMKEQEALGVPISRLVNKIG